MASPRRVGAETSATRAALLDGAERLMVRDGYAAVTYRNVAAAAGVTAGLVQYYFPKIDDLFIAMLERRGQQNVERLLAALDAEPEDPLRVIWDCIRTELAAELTVEFMALANHRKTIRAEILEVTERMRRAQLDALEARWPAYGVGADGPSPAAVLFLVHAIPKMILLEESIGLTAGHDEVLDLLERQLAERTTRLRRKPARRARPR